MSALHEALERDEFVLRYQPMLDLKARGISGVKALLRWHHPQLGLVAPSAFLATLEANALILPVGSWVLASAAAQARRWAEQGLPLLVSVSLSARQFYKKNIAHSFAAILEAAGVPARLIELEISSAILIDRNQNCDAILQQLRQLGVRLALRDCGTGNAAMNYLKRFPVDAVTIEKPYVDELRDALRPDAGAMVRAIVTMAHNVHMRTLACGVESAAQLARLTALDCDEAFGYYLSSAVAPEQVAALVRSAPHWLALAAGPDAQA